MTRGSGHLSTLPCDGNAAQPSRVRVWKFERVDGSHVYATGDEVALDQAGYIVRGERIGFAPYQCWFEEVEPRV